MTVDGVNVTSTTGVFEVFLPPGIHRLSMYVMLQDNHVMLARSGSHVIADGKLFNA